VVTAVLEKLIGMASCASYMKFKKCIGIYMVLSHVGDTLLCVGVSPLQSALVVYVLFLDRESVRPQRKVGF